MKVLITAFEPFRGEAQNSSQLVLESLPERVGEVEVVKVTLPVTFADAPAVAIAAIEREWPQAVVCLGQASTRACVNLERIAVNMAHANNPDNAGAKPCRQPVVAGGPDGIFCKLPVDDLAQAVRAAGYPCAVSNTAGLYVCNTLYYSLLHRYADVLPVLFVHLPYAHQQAAAKPAATPSMSVASMSDAIAALLAAISAAER